MTKGTRIYFRRASSVATIARRIIEVGGAILVAIFAWLQLKNIPFVEPIRNAEPLYILQFELAFYYLCWYCGTKFDVTTQESIYVTRGPYPWRALAGAFVLLCVAGVLLWASDDEKKFSAVLILFLVINVGTWQLLVHEALKIIKDSEAFYSNDRDYFALAQLKIVQRYIAGNWQWYRFAGMGVIVAGIGILCFLSGSRQIVGHFLAGLPPFVPEDAISRLLPELGFFIFLLFAEGWIWTMRAITRACLYVLDQLEKGYELKPRHKR